MEVKLNSPLFSDLLISESYSFDVGGVLSEYTLHIWRPTSQSLIFSPSGVSHLVSILSLLKSSSNQRNNDLSSAVVNHQSINNTVQFHVSTKSLYDDLKDKLGSIQSSNTDQQSNVLVKLQNRTFGLVEEEKKELEEGGGVSILASHQVGFL